MDIKTKDLIKILPFDDAFRQELLETYDTLVGDQKLAIDQMLWEGYDALFALKLEENTQLALLKIREGEGELTKDFYKQVHLQTEQEMQSENVETSEKLNLEEARKAMEKIVREIQRSKVHKKQ